MIVSLIVAVSENGVIGKDNGLIYIDYYSSMVDKKKGLKSIYGYDGVHPTRSGYKVMQKIIKTSIPGIK